MVLPQTKQIDFKACFDDFLNLGWPSLSGMVNTSTYSFEVYAHRTLFKHDVNEAQFELDIKLEFSKILEYSKFFTCSKSSNEPNSVEKIIPKFWIWAHRENSVEFCKIVTKTTYFKNDDEEHWVIFFLEPFPLLVPFLQI